MPPDIFRQQVLSEGQSSTDTNISSDADSGFQRSEGVRLARSETQSFSDSDNFILNETCRSENSSEEGMFRSTEDSVGDYESLLGDYSGLNRKWMKSVDAATLNIIQVLLYSKFHPCMFLFLKYLGF